MWFLENCFDFAKGKSDFELDEYMQQNFGDLKFLELSSSSGAFSRFFKID